MFILEGELGEADPPTQDNWGRGSDPPPPPQIWTKICQLYKCAIM